MHCFPLATIKNARTANTTSLIVFVTEIFDKVFIIQQQPNTLHIIVFL